MKKYRNHIIICVFLIIATLLVYGQVLTHEFINFDDDRYIAENRHVQKGLTLENIKWAFTTFHASNWHPVTWLSHMTDIQLYGLNPAGHHFTNLLLHILNTLLLFFLLSRMTGSIWRSGMVAALFALHPLHVESVAWAAERKDVLSTFFMFLTIWAYVKYTGTKGLRDKGTEGDVSRNPWYIASLALFALGLMSKPMLVTLPFVLLLLDYWPLNRIRNSDFGFRNSIPHSAFRIPHYLSPFLKEKIPFLVLAAASGIVTFIAQQKGGAVGSMEYYSFILRMANALVAYAGYLIKMFWPFNLAVFYPHPGISPLWQIAGSIILLSGISVFIFRNRGKMPYLVFGWLWYLLILIPVAGLVQVGSQAIADRYTYIPLIGIFIMIAWAVPDMLKGWRYRGQAAGIAAGLLIPVLMICSWVQAGYWQNSIVLFKHALAVTTDNGLACYNLGAALSDRGQTEQAIGYFRQALQINPDDDIAYHNLGVALIKQGKLERAIDYLRRSIQINPDYYKTYYNLALALDKQGNLEAAVKHYRRAIQLKPDYTKAYTNLGVIMARQEKMRPAIDYFKRALQIDPGCMPALKNLKRALSENGKKQNR
ncbi:tetratricopeptide repeat protein [Candidatus Margulisiibacteriota bacterium]